MNREHAGPYVSIPQEQFDSLHAQLQERDEQIAELKYSCQVTMENKDNLKVQLAEKHKRISELEVTGPSALAERDAVDEVVEAAIEYKNREIPGVDFIIEDFSGEQRYVSEFCNSITRLIALRKPAEKIRRPVKSEHHKNCEAISKNDTDWCSCADRDGYQGIK